MHIRIAEEQTDGAVAVHLPHWAQQAVDFGPRLRPGGPVVDTVSPPDERVPQSRRVVVELAEGDALGAYVALREDVRVIPAHASDGCSVEGDFQAARRFAQRAGSKCSDRHGPSVGAEKGCHVHDPCHTNNPRIPARDVTYDIPKPRISVI